MEEIKDYNCECCGEWFWKENSPSKSHCAECLPAHLQLMADEQAVINILKKWKVPFNQNADHSVKNDLLGLVRQRPKYTHDCKVCTFVGNHNSTDLYYCQNGGPGPTVIARRSTEPSDYMSGLTFAVQNLIPELRTALNNAIQRSLCDEKGTPI